MTSGAKNSKMWSLVVYSFDPSISVVMVMVLEGREHLDQSFPKVIAHCMKESVQNHVEITPSQLGHFKPPHVLFSPRIHV